MFSRLRAVLSISATLAVPGLLHAVDMGNIEVQSAMDEPFRAKIPLSNLNSTLGKLKLGTASSGDYGRLGMQKSGVSLSYRVQDNGDGTGVLWVSSQQPVTQPFLDIVLDVDDNEKRFQHKVSAMVNPSNLQPANLKSDNAPLAAQQGNFYSGTDVPLVPQHSEPPPLLPTPAVDLPQIAAPEAISNTGTPIQTSSLPKGDEPVALIIDKPYDKAAADKAAAQPAKASKQPAAGQPRKKYQVVRRDTLWDISMRVSREQNIPINKVMQSIQAINRRAFIGGNPNRLRSGVTLSIPRFDEVNELARELNRTKKQAKRSQAYKAKRTAKKSTKRRYTAKKTRRTGSKRTQTKRLAKSEMRIVAPSYQGKAQGETKASQFTGSSKLPPQIASQVKKSRRATIDKRKRVNKLNAELSSYSQKIKLQNAKLAELEARLKQLQKNKPAPNAAPKNNEAS